MRVLFFFPPVYKPMLYVCYVQLYMVYVFIFKEFKVKKKKKKKLPNDVTLILIVKCLSHRRWEEEEEPFSPSTPTISNSNSSNCRSNLTINHITIKSLSTSCQRTTMNQTSSATLALVRSAYQELVASSTSLPTPRSQFHTSK